MRAICLGALLLLLSAVSAPAKDADFLNSLWGDPQGQYGSWSVLVRNLDSAPAYLYEPCDDDQFCLANTFCETGTAYCSTVTQTCQCTQPNPGGGTGCVHPGCGYGQVFNAAACTCECSAVYCESPQVQDPLTCACGCPDPGCPVPQMWNHGTCTCTCLNSGIICGTNTVWNPDTCECQQIS